jgi:hypothetical protein
MIRLAHLLDEPVLKDLVAQLAVLGQRRRVVRGRRMRVDTTVVETNIHYPTDATLLADSIRVLTRTLQRLGEHTRNRSRSVARRVFEIAQRSRTAGLSAAPAVREQSKARMKALYQGLMGITRAVVRQAETTAAREPRALALWPTIDLVKRAECVNDFETPSARIYCRTPAVSRGVTGVFGAPSVGSRPDGGGLIQTAVGTAGGTGGRRTKRSGWAA